MHTKAETAAAQLTRRLDVVGGAGCRATVETFARGPSRNQNAITPTGSADSAVRPAPHFIGTSIFLSSGRYFNFMEPEQFDYQITEIAHALANICRFAGQTREFYSVAQHSVLVSLAVPIPYALGGLLHDAAEAFVGDVTKPLKALLPDYQVIEKRILSSVLSAFGLPPDLPREVHEADLALLATERRDLLPHTGDDFDGWLRDIVPLPDRVVPLVPEVARTMFMLRYTELTRR